MRRSASLPGVLFLGAVLFAGGASALNAQDAPSGGASPFSAGLSASLSTESISGETFQAFGLLPDLGYGPFGIGLDLSFHFRFYETPGGTFGFYPRSQDWWDSSLSTAQNVDKYLSRIAYLRWGRKGDPLYVQAGLLPSTTLGSGFIVGGYTNGALRPALRYTGLEIDASGSLIGFPYAGFESFVGNISAFDVLGLRAYLKPFGLTGTENPILKELQVGATLASDSNVYAQSPSLNKSGSVLVTGIDALAPLVTGDIFSATASADVSLQGSHAGGALGVGGKAFTFLRWGLQGRVLGDNFLPGYFDRGYEANRVKKYLIYSGAVSTVPGTVGWLATLGTSFLGDQISFGATLSGPFSAQDNVWAQPQLQANAQLKAGLLPIGLDAFYVKNGLTSFAKLTSPEDALIGAKVGYTLGAVTLSIVYDLRYLTESERAAHNGDQWVTTSRVETAVKMF